MKRLSLLAIAIIFVAGTAVAGPFPKIGLYSDESRSSCDFMAPGMAHFTVWVWVEPSDNGAFCAEYQLQAPAAGLIIQAAVQNPDANLTMGTAVGAPGLSICFPNCQFDWFWTTQIPCYALDSETQGYFTIIPHATSGSINTSSCIEPDHDLEDLIPLNEFGVNAACVVGTEESSWGAIKSMMD